MTINRSYIFKCYIQGLTASASAAEKKHPFAGFAGLTSSTGSKLDASTFGSVGAPQITSNLNAMEAYEEAFTVLNKEFKEFISEQQRENPSSSWNAAVEVYSARYNLLDILIPKNIIGIRQTR
jgi:hypothetical protein